MKIWKYAYIIAFMLLCTLGVIAMPFSDGETRENRRLAEFPELTKDGGANLEWAAEFELWLGDHVGLRATYAELYARGLYALGASADEQVIIGKDGRLFFAPTIADYTGVGAPDMDDILSALDDVNAKLASEGVKFVVLIAPNKNSVYPRYMPEKYPCAAQYLSELARRRPDMFVDAFACFSEREDLYYETDTHWNERGARMAAALLIDKVNRICGVSASIPDISAPYERVGEREGDLAKLLFPVNTPAEPYFEYADSRMAYTTVGRYRGADDITITTKGGEAELNALVLRDSFCDALLPYISNAYSNVRYSRAVPYVIDISKGYDAVILVIAQRRLGELLATPIEIRY